ncbi:hypothetical protein OUZ56_014282 [Daphnia magna]|uniref:Uncharacterized protein n=1 Tax=Daphnia magna TaxID=35525 RepID=A0ABR0AJE9_9CRUS|nr:hypothetical protein OUZ56_014282 [Daphnia magna]
MRLSTGPIPIDDRGPLIPECYRHVAPSRRVTSARSTPNGLPAVERENAERFPKNCCRNVNELRAHFFDAAAAQQHQQQRNQWHQHHRRLRFIRRDHFIGRDQWKRRQLHFQLAVKESAAPSFLRNNQGNALFISFPIPSLLPVVWRRADQELRAHTQHPFRVQPPYAHWGGDNGPITTAEATGSPNFNVPGNRVEQRMLSFVLDQFPAVPGVGFLSSAAISYRLLQTDGHRQPDFRTSKIDR